ncbi:forkhead box protein P1-like isoform X2 [Corticium candelabrum]|uniref:forkhead box protein P1-like isoform X2 n=1 Tax=Corticium candelabrum TaxID=121492 RepID=UPI002E25E923|nr:forkhead box protein P1-like isoform X2 [Corticium candelabrum]
MKRVDEDNRDVIEDDDVDVTNKSEPEDERSTPQGDLQIDLSQNEQESDSQLTGSRHASWLNQLWSETANKMSQVIIQPPGVDCINSSTSGPSNGSKCDVMTQSNLKLLYKKGSCQWAGCSTSCRNLSECLKHLNSDHNLSEKTIAQFRVQAHVVSQLETQLAQERTRLYAMYSYLNECSRRYSLPSQRGTGLERHQSTNQTCNHTPTKHTPGHEPETAATPMDINETFQKAGLHSTDIEEIRQALEPHHYIDQRPPFTYALLIRQAILESPEKQLTLNEIYEWFSRNFVYFKWNLATWKNAVRHNLSLHKCFMRVENLASRSAVWLCDDQEFLRRKTQRSHNSQRESHNSYSAEQWSQPPVTRPMPHAYAPASLQQTQSVIQRPVGVSPSTDSATGDDTNATVRSPIVMEPTRIGSVTPYIYQNEVDSQRTLGRGMYVGHPVFTQPSMPIMSSPFFMQVGPPATAVANIRYVSSEEATAKQDGSDQETQNVNPGGSPDSSELANGGVSPERRTVDLLNVKRERREHKADEENPRKQMRSCYSNV